MTCRNLLTACTLGFAISLSCAAMAQSGKNTKKADAPAEPPAEATHEPERNILAGPEVESEAETGRGNPMTAPNNVGKPRGASNGGLPFRQWMDVVRGVELAPDQQERIIAIAGEFQTAQRRFQRENGEKMRTLQEQVRRSRESGVNPPEDVREQYQKYEAASPKPAEYQRRVWEELTAEQQTTVRTKLAEIEQRRAAEKAGAKMNPGSGGEMMMGPAAQSTAASTPPNGDRNEPKKDANEGGGTTTSGEGQKAAPSRDVMPEPASEAPAARERVRPKKRAEGFDPERAIGPTNLDPRAMRRLKFLLEHQSSIRPGNQPSAAEKSFKFDEDRES